METLLAEIPALIEKYEQGPSLLKQAVSAFPQDKLTTPLPPGAWSVHQIVCHLADFETVYADRIKAIVAEDGPQIPGRNDSLFAARLRYEQRCLDDEFQLMEIVRRQMALLLKSLSPSEFQRVGIHSLDGPLSVATLLARITGHIPHHVEFIERKKSLLG